MAGVVFENVYKSFARSTRREAMPSSSQSLVGEPPTPSPPTLVLRAINLEVRDGEFMVLVGPSGCGKSTLLRLLAGLEEVTAGNIWVGDRLVNTLPPRERDIAMVFQNYALYPHMTVYDNLAFGLRRTLKAEDSKPGSTPWLQNWLAAATRALPGRLRYWSDRERLIDQRVRTVAQMLQIETLLERLPKQLSGGQKQRVALGRAMARKPQVFLMDEPLSNLDAKLRTETRGQIVSLQRQLGTTTLYVTHDQTEAMTMGDRIAIVNAGQIQQIASPLELYNQPANQFVAEFIGSPPMNFLTVQFRSPLLISHDQFRLTLPEYWAKALATYDGQNILLGVRPEHLSITVAAPKNLAVQVQRVEALGSETYLTVALLTPAGNPSDQLLQARIGPDCPARVGDSIWLAIEVDRLHLFDPATTRAITPAG